MSEESRSRLMGQVLALLDLLRENHIEPTCLWEPGGEEVLRALPGAETLWAAHENLRFIEEMPGGMLIYYGDGEEEIAYVNGALLGIFGCATASEFRELTGNSFRGMVHPEDLEAVELSIQEQIAHGQLDLDYVEYRILRRDGTVRWVEDYGHFIRGIASRDVFYVFLSDATEKRDQQMTERAVLVREKEQALQSLTEEYGRAQQEQMRRLEEALERADRAMSAKDTFLSNMSHDMRTPMNAIFGFAALAKNNLHDPAVARSYIERMEASGRQLLGMIERVLEISEAVSGDTCAEEAPCDLCEIVEEIYAFMVPQAVEKKIDFTLNCEGVQHSGIYSDEERLRQLVMYLTNNAVTYTKPGGRVCIVVTERIETPVQSVYSLAVEDNGIGISQEFLSQIFEPFSRERNTTDSGVHGIGLGMAIAKNIVDMLGGIMDVQSEVDRGSTFTASFRFRFQPHSLRQLSGGQRPSGVPRKILLVEDNELNLEIATELLREQGIEIEAAENGSVAVEKIKHSLPGEYDVVLMDIQMPVMNGWQAARAIRSLPDLTLARIPIIALSANVFESDRRKSAESGMNAHLAKPMDVDEVLRTIAEILENNE